MDSKFLQEGREIAYISLGVIIYVEPCAVLCCQPVIGDDSWQRRRSYMVMHSMQTSRLFILPLGNEMLRRYC